MPDLDEDALLHIRSQVREEPAEPPWGYVPMVRAEPHTDQRDPSVFAWFWLLDHSEGSWWVVRGLLGVLVTGAVGIRQLVFDPWDETPTADVKSTTPRKLRIGAIREHAVSALRTESDLLEQTKESFGWRPSPEQEAAIHSAGETATNARRKAGRPGHPPEHYERIAVAYLELLRAGYTRGILDELARRVGKPKQTIRDWVHRARELGFLEPAPRRGKPGGGPGPNLNLERKEEGDG